MSVRRALFRKLKFAGWLFLISLVVVSILGACVAYFGKITPYRYPPTLPHEAVSFPSQAPDRLELGGWLFTANSPKAVVIVHGWSGNRARLTPLAEHLNQHGFNVLTFDLRGGTGRNTYGQREAQDLAGAVMWLQESRGFSPNEISVVGNSVGGAAATLYAAEHPVRKLVLISPILDVPTTKRTILRDYHFILPGLYALGSSAFEHIVFGVNPPSPIKTLPQVAAPTLILHGTNDELSPVEQVATLPQSTTVTVQLIEGGSHTFFDDDMQETQCYMQQIRAFLER